MNEVGEVFKQALVLPKCITRKKTLKLAAHNSSDEAIAQMELEVKIQQQKKRKKHREEREMKQLQKQKERNHLKER